MIRSSSITGTLCAGRRRRDIFTGKERTGDFLNWLYDQEAYKDSNILITTHGAALAGLLNNIRRQPLEQYWGIGVHKNCAVTKVDVTDKEAVIEFENEVYYKDEENRGRVTRGYGKV